MYNLDRTRINGREIEVEFARGDRKCKWPVCFVNVFNFYSTVLIYALYVIWIYVRVWLERCRYTICIFPIT